MAGFSPSSPLYASTINQRFKIKTAPISQKSVLMGGLESHGCIAYNKSGLRIEWRPEIRRDTIVTADPYRVRMVFDEPNPWVIAALDWCSFNRGVRIPKIDRLANRGDEAFYNLVDTTVDRLAKNFIWSFAKKLYQDGTADPKELQGLETIFATTGLVSGSPVGNPSGSYAGLSQALGGVGGSWDATGTWPHVGQGTPDFYAWSPMKVDYRNSMWTSAPYSAATATWFHTWRYALNFAYLNLGRLQDREPDVCIMPTNLFRQAEDSLVSTEKFEVTANSGLTKLGHKTVMFKGLELAHEFNCRPEGSAFLFDWENIELQSMQGQLLGFMQEESIETSDQLKAADFYGQLIIKVPGFMAQLAGITAGS